MLPVPGPIEYSITVLFTTHRAEGHMEPASGQVYFFTSDPPKQTTKDFSDHCIQLNRSRTNTLET